MDREEFGESKYAALAHDPGNREVACEKAEQLVGVVKHPTLMEKVPELISVVRREGVSLRVVLAAAAAGLVYAMRIATPRPGLLAQLAAAKCGSAIALFALITCAAGAIMLLGQPSMGAAYYMAYTVFDVGLLLIVLSLVCLLARTLGRAACAHEAQKRP